MLTCILYIFSTQRNHQDMQRFIPFTWAFSTQKAEDLVTKKYRSNNKERLPPSRTNIAPEQNRPSPKGKLQRNNLQHLCFEGVFSFLKKNKTCNSWNCPRFPPPKKKIETMVICWCIRNPWIHGPWIKARNLVYPAVAPAHFSRMTLLMAWK